MQDAGDLAERGDPARQREVVYSHEAQCIMEAIETPSIQLERTDARVGL